MAATNLPGTFQPKNALEVVTRVLPKLVTAQGQWTPFEAAAELYDEVEIRTAFTPPVTFDVRELGASSPGPNPLGALLKPSIILRGSLGQRVLAPYGVPSGFTSTLRGAALALLFVGGIGSVGYALGRRSRRK